MLQRAVRKKINYIIAALAFALVIIAIRLCYLQILLNHNFFMRSQNNFLRLEAVPSLRGNILDCHGNLLATNRPINTLYWQGTGNHQLTHDQEVLAESIETICAHSSDDSSLLAQIKRAERTGKKTALCTEISFEQLCKITELYPNHPNLAIATEYKRFYPHKMLACHILGYIGQNLETMGKMGLEKSCETLLRGQEGLKLKTINSMGTNLHEKEIRQTLSGSNIATTLDLSLQQAAEAVFPKDQTGTIIIMDPKNGALRALVSRPNFDPSIFLSPLSSHDWHGLQHKQPFLNRAFNACYPPASLFKLVTMALGIEQNLVDPEELWNCKGYIRFGNRRYHCAKKEGHGYITPTEVIEKSCNTLFYDIATHIHIDTLADYAHRFGLGRKTNILFPEKEGLVPTVAWKHKTKGERWWPGETLSVAIGQSYLLSTPIQVARMIGSIFQGYLVKPRILDAEEIEHEPLDLQYSTRKFFKKAMKLVPLRGTGSRVGSFDGITLYAKTGTAQTAQMNKRHLGGQFREHGWFVVYFKPKNADPLTMVILVEHAGSSRPAIMIAKNFLTRYQKLVK